MTAIDYPFPGLILPRRPQLRLPPWWRLPRRRPKLFPRPDDPKMMPVMGGCCTPSSLWYQLRYCDCYGVDGELTDWYVQMSVSYYQTYAPMTFLMNPYSGGKNGGDWNGGPSVDPPKYLVLLPGDPTATTLPAGGKNISTWNANAPYSTTTNQGCAALNLHSAGYCDDTFWGSSVVLTFSSDYRICSSYSGYTFVDTGIAGKTYTLTLDCYNGTPGNYSIFLPDQPFALCYDSSNNIHQQADYIYFNSSSGANQWIIVLGTRSGIEKYPPTGTVALFWPFQSNAISIDTNTCQFPASVTGNGTMRIQDQNINFYYPSNPVAGSAAITLISGGPRPRPMI